MNFPGKSINELVREELDGEENGENGEAMENGGDESGDDDSEDVGEAEDAPAKNNGMHSFLRTFQNDSKTW